MAIDPGSAAVEILAARDASRLVAPFSSRDTAFNLEAGAAIGQQLAALRIGRGENPVGRKIGFTNRNIWTEYGVFAPIWGEVYDSTLVDVTPGAVVKISHLPQPRIEPEVVLGLDSDLQPGMSLGAIEAAIDWVAHGFEIVQTVFPDWKFTGADCMADGGLHGVLAVGPRRSLDASHRTGLAAALAGVKVTLSRNSDVIDTGVGSNVLDGPIHALKHLVDSLETSAQPLRKGEVVTTGTLTRAFPIAPRERWCTTLTGFDLPGLDVTMV